MTLILGVDPGLSGALAFFDPKAHLIDVIDMPVLQLTRNNKARREIDHFGVAREVDARNKANRITAAFVERVGAMPPKAGRNGEGKQGGQGVSSAFAFGRSAGIPIGVIAAHFISITEVPPVTWQRALSIPVGAGKDMHRAVAANLFPKQSELFARAKDEGRADAVLIAMWGHLKAMGRV